MDHRETEVEIWVGVERSREEGPVHLAMVYLFKDGEKGAATLQLVTTFQTYQTQDLEKLYSGFALRDANYDAANMLNIVVTWGTFSERSNCVNLLPRQLRRNTR